jgi:hypothetical protein
MTHDAYLLDAATDRLNELLLNAEEHFRQQQYRVTTTVPLKEGRLLTWTKEGPDWRLLVLGERCDPQAIQHAPRAVRIEVAHNLGRLQDALIITQRGILQEMEHACRTAEAFLNSQKELEAK